jgi:hypothetical protein
MMELRQASRDEAERDVQSPKNEDIGATFSKLDQHLTLGMTEYKFKLSEKM